MLWVGGEAWLCLCICGDAFGSLRGEQRSIRLTWVKSLEEVVAGEGGTELSARMRILAGVVRLLSDLRDLEWSHCSSNSKPDDQSMFLKNIDE